MLANGDKLRLRISFKNQLWIYEMQLVCLHFIPCHRRLLEIMFPPLQVCVELHSLFLTVAQNHFAKSRWGAVGLPHMQQVGTMKAEV